MSTKKRTPRSQELLYTELTSLKKEPEETITDYVIQAEKAVMSLRNANEKLSDGLIIAMILKGLPESYKPFAIHTTQSTEELTFAQFKSRLWSYDETEKFDTKTRSDNVMKPQSHSQRLPPESSATTTGLLHTVRDVKKKRQ